MAEARHFTILVADDDEDDIFFVRRALEKNRIACDIYTVCDGEELLDYLRSEGAFKGDRPQLPDLILLDLNMPKKNGREALAELKRDAALCHIPVVLLTTSGNEQDVLACYRLGANSYIRKPATFDNLVETTKVLGHYWGKYVSLPPRPPRA